MDSFSHGGNVFQDNPRGEKWLDFSANINPLGLSLKTRKALQQHIEVVVHYPDPEARELRRALMDFYGVQSSRLIIGNGASELFYLLAESIRPKRVLLPVPCFSEYERAARSSGAEVSYFYLSADEGFSLSISKLIEEAERSGTDAIVLGNPSNPTGTLLRKTDVLNLLQGLEKVLPRCVLVIDESFLDFVPNAEEYSVLLEAGEFPNLVVFRSLTKFFAIPGLRLGFGIASENLVSLLELHHDAWNVNSLAQAAGVAALADREYQKETLHFVQQEKAWMFQAFSMLPGIYPFPPSVNFLLLRSRIPSFRLSQMLKQKSILIRDCSNYPGLDERYLRVAVRLHRENVKLLGAMKQIFSSNG
jgi:threonine-phosphate decarboxylase